MRALALLLLVLAACTSSPGIGQHCVVDKDCKGISNDAWCSKVSVCTLPCGTGCPSGTVCVASQSRSVCLVSCTSDTECLKGWTCNDAPAGGAKACQFTDFLNEPKL